MELINQFAFFGHDFRITNARKPNKPSKDWYSSLVSTTNLSQKLALGFGAQDPMTSSKKTKPPPITHKKQKSKTSQVFKHRNCKTFSLFRGFEQLSSSIAWQIMMVQTCANSTRKVAHARLKGSSRRHPSVHSAGNCRKCALLKIVNNLSSLSLRAFSIS